MAGSDPAFETLKFSGDDEQFAELLRHRGVYLPPRSSFIHRMVVLEPPVEIAGGINSVNPTTLGAFSYTWSHLPGSVRSVGRYCSIAADVRFGELEHPTNWFSTSSFTYQPGWIWERFANERGQRHEPVEFPDDRRAAPITIGNDVWIGLGAYIRGGVTLGDGCIVGARAVVTRDVPPYAIVVGNPGRITRYRFPEPVIESLLESRWWDYAFTDFSGPNITDVNETLRKIRDLVGSGAITPYQPVRLRLVAEREFEAMEDAAAS